MCGHIWKHTLTLQNMFSCSNIRQTHKCCPCKVAAEQKARLTYDNILRLSDDPDVNNVIRFLREREIVHFQRFGEANHTNLSRIYPLWAAAHRGHLQDFIKLAA